MKPKAPIAVFESLVQRENLLDALEVAEDPRLQKLRKAMMAPGNSRIKLLHHCKMLGITWPELVEAHRQYQTQKALMEGFDCLPEVIRDVAEDSKSRLEPCPMCIGEGNIADPSISDDAEVRLTKECPRCDGKGKIRVSGDAAARALLFEATGMKGQKGPLVAQQFNFGSGGLEPLEKTVKAVQNLVGGSK